MSNQMILLWGTLIVPWLSIFLMSPKDIKRFMPASILYTLMSVIVQEAGIANGWWVIRETTYPLAVMPTYTYGLFPVLAMWVFKYTFEHAGAYFAVNIFTNAVFAFFIFPWFASRGIIDFYAGLIAFILGSVICVTVYTFQLWQEGGLDRSKRKRCLPNLQPASKKASPKERQGNTDEL